MSLSASRSVPGHHTPARLPRPPQGLYPATPIEQLAADEIVATVDEVWNAIAKTSKDAPETRAAYGNDVAPKYLAALAKKLGDRAFFGGDKPGYADLWVYAWINFFTSGFFGEWREGRRDCLGYRTTTPHPSLSDHVPTDFVSRGSPAIQALYERIQASELIKTHDIALPQ